MSPAQITAHTAAAAAAARSPGDRSADRRGPARAARAGLALLAGAACALAGCRDLPAEPDAAPGDADPARYPPPRTDAAGRLGGPDTLEIATWNIENFPAGAGTPAYVADLITSLDLDVVVVEEIASEAAWRELLERLRAYDGLLSPHVYSVGEYQKLGLVYRRGLVVPGALRLLFPADSYAFPRPPIAVSLAIEDAASAPLRFDVIGVHLKAGGDADDGARRAAAVRALDEHVRAQVDRGGEDEVIIAGDYNEVLTSDLGRARLAPLLEAPDRYTVRTLASAAAGEISFVPTGRLIDHVTTTAGLAAELASARVVIPRLHLTYSGYEANVSDHLPVVLVAPLARR
jgi:endonuclease/exonuclease/phosphatase family metal-dependent hydrolase